MLGLLPQCQVCAVSMKWVWGSARYFVRASFPRRTWKGEYPHCRYQRQRTFVIARNPTNTERFVMNVTSLQELASRFPMRKRRRKRGVRQGSSDQARRLAWSA